MSASVKLQDHTSFQKAPLVTALPFIIMLWNEENIYQFILSKEGRKQIKWGTESFAHCHDKIKHKASGSRSLEEATTKQTAWKQPTHERTLHRAVVLAFESAGFIRAEYWRGQGHSCSPAKYDIPCLGSHLTQVCKWSGTHANPPCLEEANSRQGTTNSQHHLPLWGEHAHFYSLEALYFKQRQHILGYTQH